MIKNVKPNRVVNIVYSLGAGGLENGLVNIVNRMPEAECQHTIVCLTKTGNFAERINSSNVEVVELNKREGHDIKAFFRLWKILRKIKPDIVHSRNIGTLETQLVAMFIPGVKRIHGEHGRDIFDVDGSNRRYKIFRKLMSPLIHQFVAVSRDIENWLHNSVGISSHKITQIYNGVDQNIFYPEINKFGEKSLSSEDKIVIGTVGRLAEIKNQTYLVKTISGLVNNYPAYRNLIRVMMVGDGPLRGEVERLIREHNLEDMFQLTGESNDIPELLRQMDIFALPSLGEGLSNTILEAMASGLPVIATEVGGNPELVEDGVNGLLVPVNDPATFGRALEQLVESRQMRQRMGEASLAKVSERFNWNATVQHYQSLYDKVFT